MWLCVFQGWRTRAGSTPGLCSMPSDGNPHLWESFPVTDGSQVGDPSTLWFTFHDRVSLTARVWCCVMIIVVSSSFSFLDFKFSTNVVTTVDGDELQFRRIQSVKVGVSLSALTLCSSLSVSPISAL